MAEVMHASIDHPHRFEAVFDRYHPAVYRYLANLAGHELADELAGDVFVAAFHARVRFDPTFGSVHRVALRHRCQHRPHPGAVRVPGGQGLGAGGRPTGRRRHHDRPNATDRMAYGEELSAVGVALEQLSDLDRQVIVLYAFGELSYPEIATALAIEVGTVRYTPQPRPGTTEGTAAASGQVQGRGRNQHEDAPWTSSSG